MIINYQKIKYGLLTAATAGGLALIPQVVKGAVMDQLPVPTYDSVTTTNEISTVKITDAQLKEWSGKSTLPVSELTKYPSFELQELVKSTYVKNYKPKNQTRTFKYNPSEVYAWTKTIADNVNSETQEPELVIKDGRATKFTPPTIGKQLDRYNSTLQILRSIELGNKEVDLSVKTTQPSKLLKETNDLGIIELIGRGESKFSGSPANRRHNIKVGVSKIQGVIVKPDEEFSFNKYLGPVEADQGFKPELVIKKSGTVPELGGGLCQVSSTTFRAAMHAGLPITQRRNHSYAVQYYSPQGTDATIYPGVIDLKFKNDTGHSILIWPYFKDNDYLVFDFYGTYDGREVKLNQPSVFDRKSDGSMKASWTRTVIKDGNKDTQTFSSVYQPPALFHKEEEFVSGESNQPTTPATTEDPNKPTTPTEEKPSSNTNN